MSCAYLTRHALRTSPLQAARPSPTGARDTQTCLDSLRRAQSSMRTSCDPLAHDCIQIFTHFE